MGEQAKQGVEGLQISPLIAAIVGGCSSSAMASRVLSTRLSRSALPFAINAFGPISACVGAGEHASTSSA